MNIEQYTKRAFLKFTDDQKVQAGLVVTDSHQMFTLEAAKEFDDANEAHRWLEAKSKQVTEAMAGFRIVRPQ